MKAQSLRNSAARSVGLRLRVFNFVSLMCGLGCLLLHAAEPPTYYVNIANPTPVAPYTSWATAATNIQQAIDAGTEPGRVVLVTNGVYRTGSRETNGLNRVALRSGVTLQSVNGPTVTLIEGASARSGATGESYIRCAYLGANAVLSGFTLTNGHTGTWGDWGQRHGGGAWCELSARLTNCVLTGNSADQGGAVAGGTVRNCVLTGNVAIYGSGAYNATLHDCVLDGNGDGHGIGGGAHSSTLYRCTLSSNRAGSGGGVSSSTLYQCTLAGNSAQWDDYRGGGGGAFADEGADCKLYNCVLTGNTAANTGGGTFRTTLYNCTLTGNTARSGGGASGGRLYNCIVYFNTAQGLPNNYQNATFQYSCTTPLPSGAGNINADPRLVSATHLSADSPCIGAGSPTYTTGSDIDGEPWGSPPCIGADQLTPGQATGPLTMRIEASYTNVLPGFTVESIAHSQGSILSSVWDFGDGTLVTNQAFARHAWPQPGLYAVRLTGYNDSFPQGVSAAVTVRVSEGTYYVNVANSTPVAPYTSWATAATNIQQAIDAGAEPGRLVLVTNGVYRTGNRETNGLNRVALPETVTVRSVNGPEVTVIEGAAAPGGGNGAGAIRCAYLGTNAVLSGFTLTNGHTFACCMGDSKQWSGGGALGETSGVLTNCVLTGNSAGYGGGARGLAVYDCTVTANSATYGGGASRSTLYHCVVSRNSAIVAGGGAADASSLRSCTLTGNSAGEIGGGISDSTLRNCTLTANSAQATGGGAYGGTLYNCTLTGNSAGQSGGGAVGGALYNCLVYHNTAEEGANYAEGTDFLPSITAEYCCTTPLPSGPGNFDADPRLASATHLSLDSPCIAAGNKDYAAGTDLDGEPWADPPCIGADQLVPGHALGPLAIQIEANYTNVNVGYPIRFAALSQGPILASAWDFGDGTVVTNRAFVRHGWSTPGIHTVRLTGYNDSEPAGASTTLEIQVLDATYYVNVANPSPVAPYTSWETAATNIQQAIDAGSLPGRLVLVTNGVYRTGRVDTNGMNRVVLRDPVLVRSVNGPEPTIIEGSRNNPETGQGEDVRCAYVGPGAILSGFTLTKGCGNWWGDGGALGGGGALCAASGVLTNCVLTGNQASDGGGVYGGTLYTCTLRGNSAAYGGGAQSSTLYNCVVSDNTAGAGGGVSECTLYGSIIIRNSATGIREWAVPWVCPGGGAYGGALYNCTVIGNSSQGSGGGASGTGHWDGGDPHQGVHWDWDAPARVHNCIVYANQAPRGANWDHCAIEYSCTTPLPEGAGNLDADPQLLTLSHLAPTSPCIGAGSIAYATGSDIDGEPWGNPPCMGADQVGPGPARGALTMRLETPYATIGAGYPAAFVAHNQGPILWSVWDFGDGTTLTNEPWVSHAWTAPGVYTVRLTGYNDAAPEGASATLEVQVDDVAYYVDAANPTPQFPYTSWAAAATNLQQAIDAGTFPRLVLVTNGVYRTGSFETNGFNRVFLAGPVLVRSVNGPAATIIEGGTQANEGHDVRCAYVGEGATLSGFTLRQGHAYEGGGTYREGGGAYCDLQGTLTTCTLISNSASSGGGVFGGTLRHCMLTGNSAGSGGGASRAILHDCTLTGNSASTGGGASDSTLYRCVLNGNSAGWSGGGASASTLCDCTLDGNWASLEEANRGGGGASESTLSRCLLTGNWAIQGGGAQGSVLDHCTLTGNSGVAAGGGAYGGKLRNCTVTENSVSGDEARGGGVCGGALQNCTVTGNTAAAFGAAGGGVAVNWNDPPTLYNCLVYFNQASFEPNYTENCTFEYSCAAPLPPGPGNINADPRFVNAAAGDFHLRPDSPCIDAGTNLVDLITMDLDGHPRPLDGNGDGVARFDMGAYEFDPGVLLRLTVALTPTGLRLEWPTTGLGSKLQRTASFPNPVWQDVPGSEIATTLTLPMANTAEFFRMAKP